MADQSKEVYEILGKDHPTETEFKSLLAKAAPGVLAKRYLSSGLPFVFKDQPHKYLAFRESAGRIFGVPPQQIAVMGSARFGFSTSPRKQEGGAKPLDENSDMDLVVISPELYHNALRSFSKYCFEQLREHPDLTSEAAEDEQVKLSKVILLSFRHRAKALFYGYVSPSDLENGTQEKQHFYDMQREAATQLFGTAPPGPINRVGVRVYRDWDAAERAYEFSFKKLAELQGIEVADAYSADDLDEDPRPSTARSSTPTRENIPKQSNAHSPSKNS
jgi:hypothetical protein